MPEAVIELLEHARELLSEPARWTQNALARTAENEVANGYDPNAICWCLYGALQHAAGVSDVIAAETYIAEQLDALGWERSEFDDDTITNWNDDPERIHQDVLTLLDECIVHAKESLAEQHAEMDK